MRSHYQNRNEHLNIVCFIVLPGSVQCRSLSFKVWLHNTEIRTTKWLFSHCSACSHRTRLHVLFQSCLFTSNQQNQVQKMNGENGRKGAWTIWGKMLLNISKRNWIHFYTKTRCTVMPIMDRFLYKCDSWILGCLNQFTWHQLEVIMDLHTFLGDLNRYRPLVFNW